MTLGATQYWGNSDERWDLDGLTVSLTRYPPLQKQVRHRHENPTYFFLLAGEFSDLSAELGQRCPGRFELLFHPADSWHEGFSGADGRLGLNIEPSSSWLLKFDLSVEDLGAYRVDADPIRSSELLRLATCGFDHVSSADQLLEVLLPPRELPKDPPSWLRLLDQIRQEARHLSLASLAEELGVHPVYLARVFRSHYGCSVTDWFLRKRFLQSAKALMDGRLASEVAHEAGFADQSHFGRVFRAYTGRTPREFQRHWAK